MVGVARERSIRITCLDVNGVYGAPTTRNLRQNILYGIIRPTWRGALISSTSPSRRFDDCQVILLFFYGV